MTALNCGAYARNSTPPGTPQTRSAPRPTNSPTAYTPSPDCFASAKCERAQRYVTEVQTGHNQFLNSVTSRIDDQTLAALVVAKGSMASERGVELVIADDTRVGILPLDLAANLETVIGNFVDNALDACAGVGKRQVVLTIIGDPEQIVVEVRDNGPGVEPSLMPTIFDRGVSTKAAEGTRGIGLALAKSGLRATWRPCRGPQRRRSSVHRRHSREHNEHNATCQRNVDSGPRGIGR